MLKSSFKTAFRVLLKSKTFTFINIFGLAAGTFCCLYILLYVQDQYSYDKHHIDAKDIYRVDKIAVGHGNRFKAAITAAPLAAAMKHDFPEVVQVTRVAPFLAVEKHLVRYKEKTLWEKDALLVDSTFFAVFTYHAVRGNLLTALNEPGTVVLLKSLSDNLFGTEDPIGKTISIDNARQGAQNYTVTGVVDESLGKSHLHAGAFITMHSEGLGNSVRTNESWGSNAFLGTYVKLRPGAFPASIEKEFPDFTEKYEGRQEKDWGYKDSLYLQSVSGIHTTGGFDNAGIGKPVDSKFLMILLLIAGLIQLIACINFMNLSTARASKRAKEVGVRKVIGAGRNDLIRQFLAESFLLSLIGVLIALPLLLLALPWLNGITGSSVTPSFLADYRVWLMMLTLIILTGLVAGSYPAFYLSAFNVIRVLKGNFTNHMSGAGIRRVLVVLQFVLSIVLITGIIVIYSQLNYIKNKDLGFSTDQRLIFTFNTGTSFDGLPAFMNDLHAVAGVKEVSDASHYISTWALFNNSWMLPGQGTAEAQNAEYIVSDEYFIRANGIRILYGRDFWATDSSKVIINETFARMLGLKPATAVGAHIHDYNNREMEIVGVMKDFNFSSLHEKMGGFLVWINNKSFGLWPNVTVHVNTKDYKTLLAKIATIWHKDVPGTPFEYTFLDQQVQKQYETDITLSRIINSFTLMAIIISSLGLFGLAAFSAEQRTKEIGIRKVLGASVTGLAGLLSTGFLKLVGIAYVIAAPIAWWAMHQWLQSFAFRITISWWMLAMAGLLSVAIALVTVSFHAVKAAIANPVNSLKAE